MSSAGYADLRSWLNPRFVRFWLLLLLIVYTLGGFLLLPRIVQQQLPVQSQSLLNRTATVEAVTFNPFTLQLHATGFRLADSKDVGDNATLAAADKLHINLQLRSLLSFAIVLGDLELAQPTVYLTRKAGGETNIGQLIAELDADAASKNQGPDTQQQNEPLRLIIDRLRIADGAIVIEDRTLEESFSTRIEPVTISLDDFSTLPDGSGAQLIGISTEDGSQIDVDGQLAVNPLQATGRVTLTGSPLGIVHRYLRENLNFEFDDCCLDGAFDYDVRLTEGGQLRASIEGADLSLRDVVVRSIDSEHSDREIVSVPELRLSGGRLQWPENTLSIDAVAFSEPVLHVWSEANGELNLTGLVAEQSADAGSDNDESNQNEPDNKSQVANDDPLTVSIGKLQISGMQADFIDYSLAAPAPIGLQNAQLTISNISTRSDSNATLELTAKTGSGGTIGLAGDLSVSPTVTAALTFQLDEFALSALQPWAAEAATVTVAGGSLSLNGRLRADANGLRVERTAATIAKLQVNDARGNEKLAGWQRLQVADISLATKERRIGIGDIKLNAPFGKLQINRDGSTNFSNLTKPATDENRDDSAADAPPYRVRVGQSVVSDGRLDFSDDSLPLPFSALITEFGGTVSAFASDSGDLSSLGLSGKVGDFGQSRVTGEVNLIDPTRNADIKAEFRNVSMPETSPYTVEFVGRKIAEGKLDLDLRYQFENRKVKGDNDVTLRDFKLGEKVPHDDAMDLPLGLAVGLLRDVDGVIKMDLKVSGDLDDPSFSARNLILKAFANLITRVAATPFKLLGALVPELGSDNANRIGFDPGSAVVLPPAQEQLQQIAVALDKRPDLLLRVPGGTDAELDTAALQAASGTVSVTPAQLAELGSRRQQALIETLRNYGIADERLTPGGDSANAGPDGLVELELGIEVN